MKKTKIEWCDSTWNPVSGCYHGCPYCYAKRIAERFGGADRTDEWEEEARGLVHVLDDPLFNTMKSDDPLSGGRKIASYPFYFEPTFHRYKLDGLACTSYKNIFVGSMCDLFGEWVPKSWITEIFDACLKEPSNRYLFLTKNPKRYLYLAKDYQLPEDDNFWYGTTTEKTTDLAFWSKNHHTFVSVEPILEPFDTDCGLTSTVDTADWFIFGAETGNRKEKVVPERWWIYDAVQLIRSKNKPVFMKDSLKEVWGEPLITEFPW